MTTEQNQSSLVVSDSELEQVDEKQMWKVFSRYATDQELAVYRKIAADYPVLKAEELSELFRLRKIAVSDNARAEMEEKIILHNIRIVLKVAFKLRYFESGAISLNDLVQEGVPGLQRAIQTFDWERGDASFYTYAFPWIKSMMSRNAAKVFGNIRLPEHVKGKLNRFRKVERMLRERGIDDENVLAQCAGISREEVDHLQAVEHESFSLNEKMFEDGEENHATVVLPEPRKLSLEQFVTLKQVFEEKLALLNNMLKLLKRRKKEGSLSASIFLIRCGAESSFENTVPIKELYTRFKCSKQGLYNMCNFTQIWKDLGDLSTSPVEEPSFPEFLENLRLLGEKVQMEVRVDLERGASANLIEG